MNENDDSTSISNYCSADGFVAVAEPVGLPVAGLVGDRWHDYSDSEPDCFPIQRSCHDWDFAFDR